MAQKPIPEHLKGPITNEERLRWGPMPPEVFHELPRGDDKLRGKYVRLVMRTEKMNSLPVQEKARTVEKVAPEFKLDLPESVDPGGVIQKMFGAAGGMQ